MIGQRYINLGEVHWANKKIMSSDLFGVGRILKSLTINILRPYPIFIPYKDMLFPYLVIPK